MSALALVSPDVSVAVWVLAQICLMTVALRGARVPALVLAVTLGAELYLGSILILGVGLLDPFALALLAWTAAVVGAGLYIRSQGDYLEALRETARTAVAARESEVVRRVSEERLRIARDLHDSVAHTMAVVNVHAGAAEQALEVDPERARQSLAQVRVASRSILEELQHILSLLRRVGETGDDRSVASDPRAIGDLVESVRALGLDVRLALDTDLADHDPALRMTLYRLMQEALTNAHRHGRGPVTVTVTSADAQLLLEVANAVGPADRTEREPGYGLVGMRERAASVGGRIEAGRHGEDFRVVALLPAHRGGKG
ncbi:sensor histidine kinase [Nocardiopsis dassonvillei]|uniref:sensor histidine kinase n=1 Tax=Nocardiopsis dassonvillei TaxID=2014 RepID=UPI00366CB50D